MSIRSAYSRYIEFFDEFYGSFEDFLELEDNYEIEPDFVERFPHFSDEDRQELLEASRSAHLEDEEFDIDAIEDEDEFVEQGWVNSNIDQGGVRQRVRTPMTAAAFRAFNLARHNTERMIKRRKILANLMTISRYNAMAKQLFQLPSDQEEGNLKFFRKLAQLYEYSPQEATRTFSNLSDAGLKVTMTRAGIPFSRKSVKAVKYAVSRFRVPIVFL